MPPQDPNNTPINLPDNDNANQMSEDQLPSAPAQNGQPDDQNLITPTQSDYSNEQFATVQPPNEPILEQSTNEPSDGSFNQNESIPAQPQSDGASSNSIESSDNTPVQDIPQEVDAVNPQVTSPAIEQLNAPPAQAPISQSPERVSLTDLSSYQPQQGAQVPQAAAVMQSTEPVPDQEAKENIYTEICSQIIREQEQIIGALAVEQAQQVVGLTVDPVSYHCTVTGDGSKVIDDLIEQYRDFFGHAAVEVCKEAASKFVNKLPSEALPASLR